MMSISECKFGIIFLCALLTGCASMGYDLDNSIKFHTGTIDYSVDEVASKIQGIEFKDAASCHEEVRVAKNIASASGAGQGHYIPGTPQQKAAMKYQMQFVQDVWKAVAIREGGEKVFSNSRGGKIASGLGKNLTNSFMLKNSMGLQAQRINSCTSPVFAVLENEFS